MAAKKLPPFLIFLMILAALGVAAAALRPLAVEIRLTWQLHSPAEWKPAAEGLIEKGSRGGLARAIETALARDPKGFGAWQEKLFAKRPRDVRWALPAYEASFRHGHAAVRRATMNALSKPEWRRPEAVPVVAGALASDDPVLRWQAGYVLHGMGPGARAAVPALIRAARDPDENVRWAAVHALGAMAPAAPDAVPALIQALGDPSVLVASHAAGALGRFGPRAAAAVPALIRAFGASDVVVKVEAARALGALGRTAREALPVLLEALEGENWSYQPSSYFSMTDLPDEPPVLGGGFPDNEPFDGRIAILEAVLRLGAEAGDVLPCLSRLVRDPGYETRQTAVGVLGRVGPEASGAIPDLVRALADKEPQRRWSFEVTSETNHAAAEALGSMGLLAVPALVEALASGEPRMRYGAAQALGKIDSPGPEAISALRSTLSDPRFTVRIVAARSLKRLEPGANVVPALLDAAAGASSTDEPAWHTASLENLAGEEALPSLPLLRRGALEGKSRVLICVAARLLASMAREHVDPLRHLLEMLEAGDRSLRLHAVEALGSLASRAEEVVPPLIRVLEGDPDRDVRLRARSSLRQLGEKAGSALPALWAQHAAHEEKEERRFWRDVISMVAPGDPKLIEIRLREAPDQWEVSAALDWLVKAGPQARSLLPDVETHLEHEDPGVRVKAARALWALDRRIGPALAIAREAILDDWSSGHWIGIPYLYPPWLYLPEQSGWRNPVREEAARLLSEMGPAGQPAATGLAACLEFPGPTVRVLAAEALWRVAGDVRLDIFIEAIAESIPNLSDDPARMEDSTREALRILGEMGPAASGAIPWLERLRAAVPAGPLRAAAEEALRRVAGG